MMYYFICDDENVYKQENREEPILVKSTSIGRIWQLMTEYSNFTWSVSNVAINFDEKDYKEI